jgi:hypothetical protein
MRGKILFVAGLATGYVLGARAGRARYEKIKSQADRIWHDPNVQRQVTKAEDFVAEKAPEVSKKLTETAQDAAHAASEKIKSATSKSDPATS